MEYVNLRSAGVKVSRICLGAMTYGSPRWREWVLEEEVSRPFIRRALELGINFFDTADMYSLGVSEEAGARAQGFRSGPRPGGRRDQSMQSHGRRSQPAGAIAQAHPARH
jgi:aryl-alcohol dehydrogenase-like predicted oxidoreductase